MEEKTEARREAVGGRVLAALKIAGRVLYCLLVLSFLALGALSIRAIIIEAREPEPVVYITERTSPPELTGGIGLWELIYFFNGQGYAVQFATQAQRDDFERVYLPTLGPVCGPRLDMSKLPQDPKDAVGRATRK